jgi:hypothetical protein
LEELSLVSKEVFQPEKFLQKKFLEGRLSWQRLASEISESDQFQEILLFYEG